MLPWEEQATQGPAKADTQNKNDTRWACVDTTKPHSERKHYSLSHNQVSSPWLAAGICRSKWPSLQVGMQVLLSSVLYPSQWPALAVNLPSPPQLLREKAVSILAHRCKAIFTCCYRLSGDFDNILGSVTSACINSWSIYLYGIFQPHFPRWAEELGKMPWIYPGNHKMDSAERYWLKKIVLHMERRRVLENNLPWRFLR